MVYICMSKMLPMLPAINEALYDNRAFSWYSVDYYFNGKAWVKK